MITSTFRQTVAEVAALAKAKLPTQVNGRVESAVKLVLSHDVEPQADGTTLVGSSTDPLKQYTLTGQSCTCQDFERGQAPAGWCQHRIAAAIAKRVQALVPPSPPGETTPVLPTCGEAPSEPPAGDAAAPQARSGMRLEAQVGVDGRQVKVAVWGPDDAEVQARLQAVLAQYPAPANPPAQTTDDTPQCPTHGALKRSTKGKGWYCPQKRDDGTWCPSKGK
jgi:hypothetical protein